MHKCDMRNHIQKWKRLSVTFASIAAMSAPPSSQDKIPLTKDAHC